jgi:hypothetical protein
MVTVLVSRNYSRSIESIALLLPFDLRPVPLMEYLKLYKLRRQRVLSRRL